jgi:O-acetyl-ADP-ribose deacetylase (regulator of RNase III)
MANSILTYVKDDLFTSGDNLAHCVSKDLRMGAGIAKIFRDRYGVEGLAEQFAQVGDLAIMAIPDNKYIFYLVTKEHVYEKPTYDDLKESLISLAEISKSLKLSSVSMPKIGCGLDGLEWDRVSKIIEEVFADGSIKITIYEL